MGGWWREEIHSHREHGERTEFTEDFLRGEIHSIFLCVSSVFFVFSVAMKLGVHSGQHFLEVFSSGGDDGDEIRFAQFAVYCAA